MTRGALKKIANDNGIAWAPAWIVKDISRAVKRGTYRVPELAAYRNYRDGLEEEMVEAHRQELRHLEAQADSDIPEENVPMVESILA